MSDAFTRPRVNHLPPQHMSTLCAVMIPGGMMSYRCALPAGHASIPEDDPEPHFTPEVSRSVTAWQEWKYRQEHPEPAPSRPFVATAKGGSLTEDGMDALLRGEHPDDAPDRLGVTTPLHGIADLGHPALVDTAFDPDAHTDGSEPEGLRTREGDQVLPDGDEAIHDDQSLLIADIEERRRLGLQRYGQGHRPFNGRHTLKDWYDEQLDGLVYARSLMRMSEAAREDLIREVGGVLKRISDSGDSKQASIASMSETVVNRIMGWVDVQIVGNGTGLPDEVLESLILDGIQEGIYAEVTWGEIASHIVTKVKAERDA